MREDAETSKGGKRRLLDKPRTGTGTPPGTARHGQSHTRSPRQPRSPANRATGGSETQDGILRTRDQAKFSHTRHTHETTALNKDKPDATDLSFCPSCTHRQRASARHSAGERGQERWMRGRQHCWMRQRRQGAPRTHTRPGRPRRARCWPSRRPEEPPSPLCRQPARWGSRNI